MEKLQQNAELLTNKNRLRWACRRGMLELDVLFMPFVEEAYDDLNAQQQEAFRRLLTCDDPDLFAWFMGHQKCQDPELAGMVDYILSRVKV
ncbi:MULTISPECIES: succinate dehydrogenase assembly factor 2 [Pseudidiomarina]|uniref:FAD assembly factor SdhE n=2 Tax=Pseudidiomarina TaxID=2800384 RepID=A0A0K6GWR9_9GAMM|nr:MULTISPECIES: succinate dehydrogenase assembly factor 2 [Pseudidiomarina]RUO49772.1 succinate dehydrogenase assembly factor 2 family protein [Pseudidiomarina donghaiensis]CUA82963.1 Succinate dehydrogenase flavin-adding protein, antitoxin component of the CptAB toxin-antitoxin module [Pseudidiomarina woesei]SFV21830.1 antitoxin CptB [Pseudidiomarina donghaiensis]